MNRSISLTYNATAWRDDEHCCLAHLDVHGRVLSVSGITCVWDGDSRFDAWFRVNYPTVKIEPDGGSGFYKMLSGAYVRTVRAQVPSR